MILIKEKRYEIDLSEKEIEKYITPYREDSIQFKELVKEVIKRFKLITLDNENPKYSIIMYSETYPEIINKAIFIFKIKIIVEQNVF